MTTTETYEFQAENTQLLNLVINSLYTNKDIFLRELISNASDALDRLRFEAITKPELVPEKHTYEIRLTTDPDKRILTIVDSGIGMSREEVIANIGTIAKSGTRELLQKAAEDGDREVLSRLIGQFGVGFYSVFMVAGKVSMKTRKAGDQTATLWESMGQDHFDICDATRNHCGTTITLHLKSIDEEAGIQDYTSASVLERIVKRYSDFINYPIITKMERTEYERDDEGKIKEGVEPKSVVEDRTLNALKPIWTRPRSEVSDEDYAEFYRHVSHDWTEPLKTLSLKAEGHLEYRALLFIPAKAPLDFGLATTSWGLQLYAKQVMIMESYEELLPPYLRFVRGVIDSADLPLNISRETLQQDRHITQIRKWITSKILKTLDDMRVKELETYLKFWHEFGRILKEGVSTDSDVQERLRGLFLFETSHHEADLSSLAEYVGRMKPEQKEIYYLTGENRTVIENSPHLEAFKASSYEVLYLSDPVDEIVVQYLNEYDGKPLKSVAKGAVDLGSDEEREQAKKELETKSEELGGLLGAIQKHLDEHVKEVRLSSRLTSSPACLVGSDYDMSPQLERLLRHSQHEVPKQKRILELNPKHRVMARLEARFETSADDPAIADAADLLFGYALLAEGSELPDPARFSTLVVSLMETSLGD